MPTAILGFRAVVGLVAAGLYLVHRRASLQTAERRTVISYSDKVGCGGTGMRSTRPLG